MELIQFAEFENLSTVLQIYLMETEFLTMKGIKSYARNKIKHLVQIIKDYFT